jgi:DNA-binding response OmpR family regulator
MQKVLLVENERSIRQALVFELEDDGYEVLNATNFQEAASYISSFDCDLVISDLFFDEEAGDGIRLLNEVQQSDRPIPFIAMTAFPETNLAAQAKKLLNDRFFIKPFTALKLKAKVTEILSAA